MLGDLDHFVGYREGAVGPFLHEVAHAAELTAKDAWSHKHVGVDRHAISMGRSMIVPLGATMLPPSLEAAPKDERIDVLPIAEGVVVGQIASLRGISLVAGKGRKSHHASTVRLCMRIDLQGVVGESTPQLGRCRD